MGQHMLQFAVTGSHAQPMPARDNPWAVYKRTPTLSADAEATAPW